jgi:radical SAM superfamily enzyme YgiQ (UPF0313 family)
MKVVLTRPNYPTHLITPPLGIGYLTSYLKREGIETQIIDGLNLGMTNQEIVRRCREAEVVGISILSSYFLTAVDLAKKLKKKGKVAVIGGPQVTALPQLSLKMSGADYAVVGEGELAFAALIKALKKSKPKTKIWQRPFIKNLSRLPFPDWEQMDPRSYQKAPHGGVVKNFPVAPIMTTRGCPYECLFCASPKLWQRTIRFRQPAEVIEEIKYLVQDFGVKEIHLEDDNFTLKRAHVEEFCRLLLKAKLNISWATPNGVRADKVDKGLLKLMKKAGCYLVAFGIESGSQEILDRVAKHTNLTVTKKAVEAAHQVGLLTQGFFIFGLPGETAQTIKKTISFAKSLPLDKAQFLYLDVIPGSQLWDDLKFDRKVNWKLDSFHQVSWQPPTVDKKTLQQAQSRAFRQFFARPKQLWAMLRMIKPSQLKYVIRRVKDFKIV